MAAAAGASEPVTEGDPVLSLRGIKLRRQHQFLLDVSALDVVRGETLAVIGPNGAGKSTLLQLMAGLVQADAGLLLFDGAPVVRPSLAFRRRLALVLQEPMLLDASVRANIELGLRFRGLPRSEVRERARLWAEQFNITHLLPRQARSLSGGEAQRVSLARALALQPELLLLDEPFSPLDAPARRALIQELALLLRRTNTTAVLVTHDQDEALMLGDRLAVLLQGKLHQVDTPERVLSLPADEQVAAFVGVENILSGLVAERSDDLMAVKVGGRLLYVPGDSLPGESVFVCLRPEDVTIWPGSAPRSSARNLLSGKVVSVVPRGRSYLVQMDCSFPLAALITPSALNELGLAQGMLVSASFKATAAHVIPRG